jgi:broad specificity phosphatase PhoE
VPALLLVRHAQASFGAADYDVLSERGHVQSAAVAAELVRRGLPIARVVTGGLVRQQDTAAVIADALGVPMTVDERLDEYRADDILEHHSAQELRLESPAEGEAPLSSADFQKVLDAALLAWIAADAGSATDEPWSAFSGRLGGALEATWAALGRGENAVVVTSGGVIAAACAAALGQPTAFVPLHRVGVNASITRLVRGRSGTSLLSFNEHAHLEGGPESLVTYR